MPTCKCGKQVEDWRGARGHVQFTEGDGHGDKGDVPDGWRDLFDDDEPQDDESDEEADGGEGGGEADPSPSESEESDTSQSEASESKGRIRRALFDDVRALWGGDR